MPRYRKKPVEVEAMRFDGKNWNELTEFFGAKSGSSITAPGKRHGPPLWQAHGRKLTIRTLEGSMRADAGDWIIKGIQGEFYPCKADIFEASYELVED